MSKYSHRIKVAFSYTNAADSSKPGYLKAKFDRERKRLAEEAASQKAKDEAVSIEQSVKVHVLKGAK